MKINLAREGKPVYIEVDKDFQRLINTDLITCCTLKCVNVMDCSNCICADEQGCYCKDYTKEELIELGRVK